MTSVILKLDVAANELKLITATFEAIEASMNSNEYEFDSTAFVFPCIALRKISEEIAELTQQLFAKGASNNE